MNSFPLEPATVVINNGAGGGISTGASSSSSTAAGDNVPDTVITVNRGTNVS